MTPSLFTRVIAQRRSMDCGVAALAMLLAQSYEDTYAAATRIAPRVQRNGLYLKELVAIAAQLGARLERRHSGRYSLDDDDGILSIRRSAPESKIRWHFVVLRRGIILDPDGPMVVDVADYFALTHTKPCTLLVQV